MPAGDNVRAIAKEIQLDQSRRLGPVEFHSEMMAPLFHDGDLLIVEPVTWSEVRLGDIITYRDAEKFPTFRVIRKHADRLVLKPDNFWGEREARPNDVLARVVERRRGEDRITCHDWSWKWRTWRILSWQFAADLKRALTGLIRRP